MLPAPSNSQRDSRSRFHDDLVNALARLTTFARFLARTEDDADDLLQATCLRALERESSLASHDNIAAWLTRVMRNLHIDLARTPARRTDPVHDRVGPSPQDADPIPMWRLVDDEDLEQALPSLSLPLRRVWELQRCGLGQKQIAERLALPRATVATRIFRARVALRQRLRQLRLGPYNDSM
jgi:RNA polymerase sigma-70 factor, ECF subfamily